MFFFLYWMQAKKSRWKSQWCDQNSVQSLEDRASFTFSWLSSCLFLPCLADTPLYYGCVMQGAWCFLGYTVIGYCKINFNQVDTTEKKWKKCTDKNKQNGLQAFWPQYFQIFQTTMPIILGLAHLEIIAFLEAFMVDSVLNGWGEVRERSSQGKRAEVFLHPLQESVSIAMFLKIIKTIVSTIT